MKLKPSRAFTLCMIPLLATGAAGAWAWQKANSAPVSVRAKSTFLELLRYKAKEEPDFELPTPQQRETTRRATQDLMEKMTGEFPALRITEHPVPDAQNAFLLLYQLGVGARTASELPLSQEFRQLLSDKIPWNSGIATRCLDEHADLVSRIEHIASLTTRSSANMPDDFDGFVPARVAKNCAEILLIKARLAAEAKDEPETLRLVTATGNLASHYRGIETRTLLGETIAVLIDLSVRRIAFEHLLPALGRDADLAQWKTTLSSRGYTPADFADVMRGEWTDGARYFLLPTILREGHPDTPPDAEALTRAYSSRFNDEVTRLPGISLATLLETGFHTESGLDPKLSKRSQEIMGYFMIGSRAWPQGYCRAACVLAQYQAAFDLMMLEKSGTTLAANMTFHATPDPITDKPFVFDPTTRELSLPPSAPKIEVAPIRLPF